MKKVFTLRGAIVTGVVLAAWFVLGRAQEATPAPTAEPSFQSAVASLISYYIPSTVLIPLGSAIQNAASLAGETGDLQGILSSLLAATSNPSWVTAIPTEFQSSLIALESAIASLKFAVISSTTLTHATGIATPIPPTRIMSSATATLASTPSAPRSTTASPTPLVPYGYLLMPQQSPSNGSPLSANTPASAKSSINAGAIAGGVVGGVAVICALIFGLAFLNYKRKTNANIVPQNSGAQVQEYPTHELPGEPPDPYLQLGQSGAKPYLEVEQPGDIRG